MSKLTNNILHKHHIFTSIQDVSEIAEVLKQHLGIDYFLYRREFIDIKNSKKQSTALLTNDAPTLNYLLEYTDYETDLLTINHKDYYFVETHYPKQTRALAKDIGIYNPFTRQIRVSANEWEWASFATKSSDRNYLNFFLNNRDLLDRFLDYFTEKASHLITKSIKNKLQNSAPVLYFDGKNPHDNINKSTDLFFDATTIKHQLIIDKFGKKIKVPKAEFSCLRLLARGRSIKEIALHLRISPRTIETNIKRSKTRLNCYTKKELLDLLEINEI